MALVRCTCLVDVSAASDRPEALVRVADPTCGYVIHRLTAEMPGLGDVLEA